MIINAFSTLGLSGKPFPTSQPWYFDYGAFHYMTNTAAYLSNLQKYFGNLKIHTANGSSLPITTTGDVFPTVTNVFVSPNLTLLLALYLLDN